MIFALCLLGAGFVFLAIVVGLLYFQIIRPMQRQLAEQNDTIVRNAEASVNLYFVQCRELNALQSKVAFVEAYTVPILPEVEKAPITARSPVLKELHS